MKRWCAPLLLVLAVSAAAVETNGPPAPIRSFDIKTIESLGRQIYDQDGYAAKATDILFERVEDLYAGRLSSERHGAELGDYL